MRVHRGHAATVAGVALSAVFLWLALRGVDLSTLHASLAATRWWLALPFLASLFAFYWIKTVRWSVLLRAVLPTTPRRLFRAVMIGYAAGAVLPMQLGEVVRAWLGARRLGIRVATALMSIALERVLDLVSILLLVAAATFWMGEQASLLRQLAIPIAGVAVAALGLLLLFVFRTDRCLRTFAGVIGILPGSIARSMLEQLQAGIPGLHALRNRRLLAGTLLTSLAQWIFMFICVWLSLVALDIPGNPAAALLALVLTVIGTSLPNSPGYVGSIQLAFTLALVPFGTIPSEAIAASLFFHVLAYFSVVIVGLALLPGAGLRLKELGSLRQGDPDTKPNRGSRAGD